MFNKSITKRITSVITAAMLTVMMAVPSFAADSVTYKRGSDSPDYSDAEHWAYNVSYDASLPIYVESVQDCFYKEFDSNEKIDDILSRTILKGENTELVGLVKTRLD